MNSLTWTPSNIRTITLGKKVGSPSGWIPEATPSQRPTEHLKETTPGILATLAGIESQRTSAEQTTMGVPTVKPVTTKDTFTFRIGTMGAVLKGSTGGTIVPTAIIAAK